VSHSTTLEDLTDRIKPRSASNALLWAILAFFVLLMLWASFTKLDRTVHGGGRVVPTAQLQVVSNLEGGIVREILAKPGTVVHAGDPLIRLDTTATGADYNTNQSAYDSLQVRVARLEAEIAGRAPQFPASKDPTVLEQIGIERSLYLSRQLDLQGLTSAGQARLIQAQRGVSEAQANVDAAVVARDSSRQQADMLRPLVANGIEPRLSLMQADRQASVAAAQAVQARAALARAQSTVAEARATLAQVQQDWRAKAAQDLAETQAQVAAKRQALPALQDRVSRTIVRAPLDGRINRVMATTVGGTVRPGEPLVEIVPVDHGLTIEAHVKPSDIAFVRQGQRALVKITAYDYSIYGGLEGKVTVISPDSVRDERTEETYYTVRVVTTTDGLVDQHGRKLPISAGMVADVNLIGDKRSVLSYLLTPFTRLSEDAFTER
jgi:membrane fusion protein, adhesin transport system